VRLMANNFEIIGLNELQNMLNELGQAPRRVVRASARAGGRVEVLEARKYAPVGNSYNVRKNDFSGGSLKAGIIQLEENSSNDSKAAFDVRLDRGKNAIFQKPIIHVGKYGGSKATGYYPASMEYGFKTAKGHWEGYHYMRDSADSHSEAVKQAMVNKALEAIDRILESR
jgi:hypothetical protein